MKDALEKIIGILSLPVIAVDLLGGIVGLVWLAILGEWGLILWGVILMVIGTFILSLLLLPSFIFAFPAVYFAKKRLNIFVIPFVFLSALYVGILMYFSSLWVIGFVTSALDGVQGSLPYLFWGYCLATAPWSFMASKEDSNSIATFLPIFFLKLGLVSVIIMSGIFGTGIEESLVVFTYIMLAEVVFVAAFAVHAMVFTGDNNLMTAGFDLSVRYSNADLQAFIIVLVWIAAADGKLHKNEIREIQRVFSKLTGEKISNQFIRRVYSGMSIEELSIVQIEDMAVGVDDEMRENIIKGCAYVVKADGEVDAAESERILEIAKVLGYNKKEVHSLLKGAI